MRKHQHKKQPKERILAIDPTHRGFAYALFEGDDLIDWGLSHVARDKKNEETLERVARLIQTFEPHVFVVEDEEGPGSRRAARVERLLRSLRQLAQGLGIRTYAFSRDAVRGAFADCGAWNKEEIASEVAERYPELQPTLPPHRKIWQSEDHRINVFDAAALGQTYLEAKRRKRGRRRVA